MFSIDVYTTLTVKTIYTNKKVPSKDTFQNRHYKTELFIVIRLLDTKSRGKCLY